MKQSVHQFPRLITNISPSPQTQTLELARSPPPLDSSGRLRASPGGGRRRIDHVLHARHPPVRVRNYSFVTALAGLSDHIPVCVTIETA